MIVSRPERLEALEYVLDVYGDGGREMLEDAVEDLVTDALLYLREDGGNPDVVMRMAAEHLTQE